MYCLQNIRIILFIGCLFVLVACRSSLSTDDHPVLKPLSFDGLENVYQYGESIYGGSGPYTESDFAELKRLGIDLVVSVDGAIPKVELAKAAGMRYAHIPIGYDGGSRETQLQLVKALKIGNRIYVHCHHGVHRGPAAIASLLVGIGVITNDEAVQILEFVGTSDQYQNLYHDVRTARVVSEEELAVVGALPEVAEVSDFTRTMASVDVYWDHLKLSREAGWKAIPEHPDIDPVHEALMIHEQFRELLRQDMETDYSERELAELQDFRDYLKSATEQSAELESGLRQRAAVEYLETQYQALKQSCVSCHDAYRN